MKICGKCDESYGDAYLVPTGYMKDEEREYSTISLCIFCTHKVLQEFFHQMWPTEGENWLEDSGIGVKE